MSEILVILLGSFVGISAALLGLGGNILIVPLLPLITELSLQSIIATGILTVFFVTFFNVINFYRQGLLEFKIITLLFIPTSLSSFISSRLSSYVPEHMIKALFLFAMTGMVVKLFLPKKASLKKDNPKYLLTAAGLFSGSLAGITGVGTGILLAPLLLSLKITDDKKISPTINFLIMVSCFFSSLNYLSFSNFSYPQSGLVRLDYVLLIAVPAILSSIIGRKLNSNISPNTRRIVVGLTLLALIIKTI